MDLVDGAKSLKASSEESFEYECSPCENDGLVREARFFCSECGEYLCESCETSHRRFKSTRNHRVTIASAESDEKSSGFDRFQNVVLCDCSSKAVTFFCNDHNDVFCVDCKTLHHRSCNTCTVELKSLELKDFELNNTVEIADKIFNQIESIKTEADENICKLQSQSNACREAIQSFHTEITAKLSELEAKSIKTLSEFQTAHESKLIQEVEACKTALRRIEESKKSLKSSQEAGDNKQTFLNNLKVKQTLKCLDNVINEMCVYMKVPEISFVPNIKLLPDANEYLGEVTCGIKIKPPEFFSDMKEMTAENLQKSTQGPAISGSTFMPSGELVLCDYSNSSIKVFDKCLTTLQEVKLIAKPWNVAPINHSEVVVTLPNAKTLQLAKVLPKLELTRSVTVDKECWGLAVQGDSIYMYVGCIKGPAEIRVFDKTLKHKTTIAKEQNFKQALYVALSDKGDLFVSDEHDNSITRFNRDKQTTKITNQDLKSPLALFVDKNNHFIVCYRASNKLLLFDENGIMEKTFLLRNETHRPLSVCYRETDSTLIVTGEVNCPTLAFKVQ